MINLNAFKFTEDVEHLCRTRNMEYIDAVVHWCEKNKVEVEYAAALIRKEPSIKAKIQVEAENLNVLKRGARLPI